MSGTARRIFALFIASLLITAGAGALAAGSASDPLITRRYLTDVKKAFFTQKISETVNSIFKPGSRKTKVSTPGDAALAAMNPASFAEKAADALVSAEQPPAKIPAANGMRDITLMEDWAASAHTGAVILMLSGSLSAVPGPGASLIDLRAGTEISRETALSAGDYIMVSEQGSGTVDFLAAGEAEFFISGRVSFSVPISGAAGINGAAVFGQSLSFTAALSPAGAEYVCQWLRDGQPIPGAAAAAYTPVQADIGKTLSLRLSGSGIYSGAVTSPGVVVQKAPAAAPAAPSLASKSANSVTLSPNSALEFRRGADGVWTKSNLFTGLAADTSYTFYARRAETATHSASPAGPALSVKTDTAHPASITSSKFTVDSSAGFISKIPQNTTVSALLAGIDRSEFMKVYNGSTELSGSAVAGTGMTLRLIAGGKTLQTLSIVVTGDVSGDGRITLTDFVQMELHLLGKSVLTGARLRAGDVNGAGGVTLTDFVQMELFLLGKGQITPR